MREAYDTFLQVVVSADLAAKNGGSEIYRYECAYCGEEVRLAAVDSISMVAHFRHLRGNNHVDCEKYLGQPIAVKTDPSSLKTRNKQAEFYFDNIKKMFFLGLRFNEDEIIAYEKESAKFELRVSEQSQAFHTLSINQMNCTPDVPTLIPISEFSYIYFLSNTLNERKRKHAIFKKDGSPIFLKILGNDSEYRAKLIHSTILYTNVPYFVVAESQLPLLQINHFPNEVEICHNFNFKTMNKNFTGQKLTIKNKTPKIESLFASWGYQIKASESLTILWPPATQIDEISVVDSDEVFLFSSFKLEPRSNINVSSMDMTEIENDMFKVSISSRVNIVQDNVEVFIDRKKSHPFSYNPILFEETHERIFRVPDDGAYYLFDNSGVTPLKEGMTIELTQNSFICRYNSGYLYGIIYSKQQKKISSEQLLNDLLAHYKRTEILSLEPFANLELSDTATKYIEECIEKGSVINSVAKRFIEEGRL